MIKVGQKVVCVNNTPKDNRPETIISLSKIKVGEIYTIREILSNDGQAIALDEVVTPYSSFLGRELGFKSDRFVPLDSYNWAEELLSEIAKEIEEELLVENYVPLNLER
jgi:hypothetical protein